MPDKAPESKFVPHLRAEKLQTLDTRAKYALQKLAFVTGLLGLGSLNLTVGRIDVSTLLFLAPWVAIAFDLYILGEDYSVKRIGAFLKAASPDAAERHWETWVADRRDPFAPWAMPLLTTLVYAGAALIAAQQPGVAGRPAFIAWLVLTPLPSWLAFAYYHRLRRRALDGAPPAEAPVACLPPVVRAVAAADHRLEATAYREIARLFTRFQSDPRCAGAVRATALEYGRPEFFLCVDRDGAPLLAAEELLADFRATVARHPEYGLWFRPAELDGWPVLLAARWLCHLVGLRHRVVLLFLDHPTLADHTLLQVRSFDKPESPGLFDLPAAGHVSDLEDLPAALRHELAEELHLELEALAGFTLLGSYLLTDTSEFQNVEHRTVYYGRLAADDWLTLSAASDELAAVLALPVAKLHTLIARHPEQVASGLLASFPLYLQHRLAAPAE